MLHTYSKGIPLHVIFMLLGADYWMWVFDVEAEDSGHKGATRSRIYILFCHKVRGRVLFCPLEMYEQIRRAIQRSVATTPSSYMFASLGDVQVEAVRVATARKILYRPVACLIYSYCTACTILA